MTMVMIHNNNQSRGSFDPQMMMIDFIYRRLWTEVLGIYISIIRPHRKTLTCHVCMQLSHISDTTWIERALNKPGLDKRYVSVK